jgi:hypothetical protein
MASREECYRRAAKASRESAEMPLKAASVWVDTSCHEKTHWGWKLSGDSENQSLTSNYYAQRVYEIPSGNKGRKPGAPFAIRRCG